MMLSRPLRWALGLTLAGTAWAAWLPDEAPDGADAQRGGSARPGQPATQRAGQAVDPRRARATVATAAVPRAADEGGLPAGWPALARAEPSDSPLLIPPTATAAWADPRQEPPEALRKAAIVAQVPAASAPAVAPPLPAYALVGLVEDGPVVRALLVLGPKTVVVGAGETLEGPWRVESVSNQTVTLRTQDGAFRQILKFKPA